MKTTTILAIALGLGSLAACNKNPKEQTADNIEANAENTADTIEANADNAADTMQANADNAADTVRNVGEQKADSVRNGARRRRQQRELIRFGSSHSHAGGRPKGAPETERPFHGLEAQRNDFSDARQLAELPGDVGRDRIVDGNQRHGFLAFLAAAEAEGRDVDTIFA